VKHVALIGLGPHAQRIYYPLLVRHAQAGELRLSAIIDVQDREATVRAYLAGRPPPAQGGPAHLCFVPTERRDDGVIWQEAAALLTRLRAAGQLDGLIIACDPRAHRAYLDFALGNDLDILLDKPLTAPDRPGHDPAQAARILRDYQDLRRRHAASRANFIVQAQRRAHPGYLFVLQTLRQVIAEHEVPLSYVDIYHADGMWVMPHEWDRDNHPYKYGFGKLLHSGYHFVDLLALLLSCNDGLPSPGPGAGPGAQNEREVEIFTRTFTPSDFAAQLGADHYRRLFPGEEAAGCDPRALDLSGHGELDVFTLGQVRGRGGGPVQTTFNLALQQDSFSRRAWLPTPKDGYKGNGRVRHERVNLQVSTLMNVQVHSYQAHEVHRPEVAVYGPGHLDHFDVTVFRNSGLIGGPACERVPFGQLERLAHGPDALGHNERAREALFGDFLHGRRSASDLREHERTNLLLSRIYESIPLGKAGRSLCFFF
jgi:hypothetical protein